MASWSLSLRSGSELSDITAVPGSTIRLGPAFAFLSLQVVYLEGWLADSVLLPYELVDALGCDF